jgi:hypothetical protein
VQVSIGLQADLMGKNAYLRLQHGLNWLQKSVRLLENCFFELFLGVKNGFRPIDTCASNYSFYSKTTQLRCHAKPVIPTKLPLGRLASHISRKANRAAGRFGLHHQRANGFNHLRQSILVMRHPPLQAGQLVGQRFVVKQHSTQLDKGAHHVNAHLYGPV